MGIEQRGGKWRAVVYSRGSRIASKTFDTEKGAHDWHEKTKALWDAGKASQYKAASFTVEQLVALYREQHCKVVWSDQTFEAKKSYLERIEVGPLKHKTLAELEPTHIDEWLDWLERHLKKNKTTRQSFKADMKTLIQLFNWYKDNKAHTFQPPIMKYHRLRAAKKFRVRFRQPDYFLRVQQLRDWLDCLLDEYDPVYYQLAFFMCHTGCRVGEATGLYWDAIDWQEQLAKVIRQCWWERTGNKKPHIKDELKTDSSRRVFKLSTPLLDMLRVMRQNQQIGLVFRDEVTGGPMFYRKIQHRFDRCFELCNLPFSATHIMRHTFSTLSLQAGAQLTEIQASVGHSSVKMTEHYAKAAYATMGTGAEALAQLITPKSPQPPS